MPPFVTNFSPPANMPSHSATAITVSLSSNNTIDCRTIALRPGQVCKVGRSSRTEFKNMRAEPNNALFDCPVVSRSHAEIRACPWEPYGHQVKIVDKESLHGTTVNGVKVMPNTSFTLKSGDVIRLGDRVSRGNESHEGVSLTFTRLDEPTMHQPRTPSPTRGFQVPAGTDQSDFESEVESIISSPQHQSSAKTTPDDVKMKTASQEQPVEVNTNASQGRFTFINLVDDDDDAVPKSAMPAKASRQHVVPESIGFDQVWVEEPIRDREMDIHVSDEIVDLGSEWDNGEPGSNHTAHVSQSKDDDSRYYSFKNGHYDGESDANEEYVEGSECDGEHGYPSDPDRSDFDSEAASDQDADEPTFWDRPLSVELGEEDNPTTTTSKVEPHIPTFAPSKPRYDPVRSSQPPPDDLKNHAKPGSKYTYEALAFGEPLINRATDMDDSSRWDIRPSHTQSFSRFDLQAAPTLALAQPPESSGQSAGPAHPFLDTSAQLFTANPCAWTESAAVFPTQNPPWATANAYDFIDSNSISASAVPVEANRTPASDATNSRKSATKGKISIDDIVEGRPTASLETYQFLLPVLPAKVSPPIAAQTVPVAGTKRKADEMEAEAERVQPPRQRRKTLAVVRRLATGTAKVLGTAAIGGIATCVFLASPYAAQLNEWLG